MCFNTKKYCFSLNILNEDLTLNVEYIPIFFSNMAVYFLSLQVIIQRIGRISQFRWTESRLNLQFLYILNVYITIVIFQEDLEKIMKTYNKILKEKDNQLKKKEFKIMLPLIQRVKD